MSKNKRLSRRLVENKLAEYKTINKQISKKLNENKMEMAKLKKSLQTSRSVVSDLRKQCRRWKRNILKARNVNMDHATMEVETLKSNADKTITILNECIDDVEQFLAVPASASDACTKKRKKPRKKVGLREQALRNAFRVSVELEQAAGNASNNYDSVAKADLDGHNNGGGENGERLEGIHSFFHSDEENGASAEHHGNNESTADKSIVKTMTNRTKLCHHVADRNVIPNRLTI